MGFEFSDHIANVFARDFHLIKGLNSPESGRGT
jgi:hypothetical protein